MSYLELTNVGDDTIDLGDFTLAMKNWWNPMEGAYAENEKLRLTGFDPLPPGESWVAANVLEDRQGEDQTGVSSTNPDWWEKADLHVYFLESHLNAFPGVKDSVSAYDELLYLWNGEFATTLFYHLDNGDSVLVDGVRLTPSARGATDVAGVTNATYTSILVRKSTITQGNTDWDVSRGATIGESEWLPIPLRAGAYGWVGGYIPRYPVFNTVGNHGDYSIDVTPVNPGITINMNDSTIQVPWGIYKGDSVTYEMDLGPGMAWDYTEDPTSIEDSAHTIMQTGDILTLYACGADLEKMDFKVTVSVPGNDMAKVFPLRKKELEFEGSIVVNWTYEPLYYVTDVHTIDTIGDVPFATRVDTLQAYLEKAPNATWEIVWVDGTERVDLKWGDILKVTAENGTTVKQYFIDVQDFKPSDNARLGAITWPDKPGFLEGWIRGDTLPNFESARFGYVMTLPLGSKNVPALLALPQDMNANVSMSRAVSVSGTLEDRTTVITVTAQDDSTQLEYTIIFELEKSLADLQPYMAEPIFSQYAFQIKWTNFGLEIANTGNQPMDLSQYMIVVAPGALSTPADMITTLSGTTVEDDFTYRYRKYVPGYKYSNDTLDWQTMPGGLVLDPAVDPSVAPGDAFVIGRMHNLWPGGGWPDLLILEESAITFSRTHPNIWGETFPGETSVMHRGLTHTYGLFKILNDSIYDGLKGVTDPEDFELVDIWGDLSGNVQVIGGDPMVNERGFNWTRKPGIQFGNTVPGGSFGTNSDDSEWIATNTTMYNLGNWQLNDEATREGIGGHVFEIPTHYMSTVSSAIMLVDAGYKGALDIQGDLAPLSVDNFLGQITKADADQTLTVLSGTDGSEKAGTDDAAGGDTLAVLSKDGTNTTKYLLIDQPLDDNAVLVVKPAYSGSYTVTIDGDKGTITGSGVKWGVAIKEVRDALTVPSKATLNIIDKDNNLIPMQVLNYDTNLVDVRLNDSIFFEVIAQNGADIITYQLKPESASSDAFVVSSVFLVDQDDLTIGLVPEGIAVAAFIDGIDPVTGATVTILDKYGFDRTIGALSNDDKLKVVSEDGTNTVYYYLNILGETDPDNNLAPTLSVEFTSANTTVGGTVNLKASASDDDMPLPVALTYVWEVITGDPADVTIASPNALVTDATFSKAGTYQLQITVDDGEISRTEIVTIGVSTPDNNAPTVTVAQDNFEIKEGESINVDATATDDGNPAGSSLSYEWTVKTGTAANVTIGSADQEDSQVTFSAPGVYTLQITVSDGELVATEIVVVVVTELVDIEPVAGPGLKLYPNPVSGMLILELKNAGDVSAEVKIFSITGRSVFNAELTGAEKHIDVSGFDPGIYFVTVKAGDHIFNKRIQVVK
jgi:hypothetical protein